MQSNLDKYIEKNSSELSEALIWLERQTNIRTNHARMLSGPVVGRLLNSISKMLQTENILEIGTFTGYSAICLASGLNKSGHLDAIEINDELHSLIEEGFCMAGVSARISLHFGDAKEIIPRLRAKMEESCKKYDLVYIDANKREYSIYYDLVFDIVRSGGYIIADNVLWDGKVYQEPVPSDAQTSQIVSFNQKIKEDHRVENYILPLRDGLNIIRKL